MTARLVIIDDDPLFRSLLEELALAAGVDDVRGCGDLSEAAQTLVAPCDLILLDLHLPDGSGSDVVRSVRRLSDAAIVVLSGDDHIDGTAMRRLGADRVLCKSELDADAFPDLLGLHGLVA